MLMETRWLETIHSDFKGEAIEADRKAIGNRQPIQAHEA